MMESSCLYNGRHCFKAKCVFMYKYNGMLIYQSHDDDGVLEVVERDGVRSLHFGSYPRQSSMSLDFPDTLELAYVRAMTAWMLLPSTSMTCQPKAAHLAARSPSGMTCSVGPSI